MTHALAVGASGMLAAAVRELARRGIDVTLVARDPRRLERLAESCRGAAVRAVSHDYRDVEGLARLVLDAEERHEPFRFAIAWIHGTAPGAHEAIAGVLGHKPPRCRSWLSDAAISKGVIEALDASGDEHVVGTLAPFGPADEPGGRRTR